MNHDLAIARSVQPRPLADLAQALGLSLEDLEPYGQHKAKIGRATLERLVSQPLRAKLILVTAIHPTAAGEGKTTTTVGLGDGLSHLGKRAVIALREPSLGPCFGMKGGAAGGGRAQVIPMEDINLHFTGDFHAITAANNLLAALLDNHIQQGNSLNIDPRRISWKRCLDMNDRALREVMIGLGGPSQGVPRADGFDITVASEIMAVLCLAQDLGDLKRRLSCMVVAQTYEREDVTAGQLGAVGAMAVLLREALRPNLVQTLEGTPALVHGGPFANIAHGCNSVMATKTALKLADYVVTEAGFAADLGADKFLHIKCRQAGLAPHAVVLVATIRALKMHGGQAKTDLTSPNAQALLNGLENLYRHYENLKKWNLPVVVALNHFSQDALEEVAVFEAALRQRGMAFEVCKAWAEGGAGAAALAQKLVEVCQAFEGPSQPSFLYPAEADLAQKIELVAKNWYGAASVQWEKPALTALRRLQKRPDLAQLPICVAKTQYTFSHDVQLGVNAKDFVLPIRDLRLYAGAGFVVVYCGEIMTMPGLPKLPAALQMDLDETGEIQGLF